MEGHVSAVPIRTRSISSRARGDGGEKEIRIPGHVPAVGDKRSLNARARGRFGAGTWEKTGASEENRCPLVAVATRPRRLRLRH